MPSSITYWNRLEPRPRAVVPGALDHRLDRRFGRLVLAADIDRDAAIVEVAECLFDERHMASVALDSWRHIVYGPTGSVILP
jgi:hypothetical protein